MEEPRTGSPQRIKPTTDPNPWGDHLPLKIVLSPCRAIVAPLVNYIESLHHQRPDLTLTDIVPEIVVRHWRHRLLHSRLAARLRRALRPLPKVVVTTAPFHVQHSGVTG
ncbi:hypothetical protein GCM10009663_56310 [Kitasatospora arboriphila]|uniref:Uncharacterized protein n=1 Tax=Kitasatospora arboriphila TaxID=258052 RepID=A0ABP4EJH5_9ACTN